MCVGVIVLPMVFISDPVSFSISLPDPVSLSLCSCCLSAVRPGGPAVHGNAAEEGASQAVFSAHAIGTKCTNRRVIDRGMRTSYIRNGM